MSLFTVTLVLLLIMDPIGNINSYLSLVKELNPKKQHFIVLREMFVALVILLGLSYSSKPILNVLELSETTTYLASGIILFLIAIKILFPTSDSPRANLPQGEPFIFPLAIPLLVGPALMATILLYSGLEAYRSVMFTAIILAWFITGVILYFSVLIKQVLGQNGLIASERLIGMVLVMIAVQRLLEGILHFWSAQPSPV